MLIPPGKSKNTTTIFDPNLKQTLLNIDQNDGHWPGSYPGLPKYGGENYIKARLYKGKTHKVTSTFIQWGQAYILTCFLPMHL